jgi:hypothetical protein
MTITRGIRKGLKKILEHAGGGEEGKPHSTSAGRTAAGARKFRRGAKKVVPGVIEGVKRVAKPFVKEAVGLEKLKNRLKKKDKLSTWERKQKHRKEVQKHGGNVIYADEWDKIDPGLKKGIGLKKGGRTGLKEGKTPEHYLIHGYGSTYKPKRAKKNDGGSIKGPHGFGPKPFLNKPGQAQGTHGGKMAKATDKAIKGNKLTKKA